jgi:hypothetical protein
VEVLWCDNNNRWGRLKASDAVATLSGGSVVARKYEGKTVAGGRRARAAGDYFILVRGGGAGVTW